jgi:DNA-binding FrmR family transcriptional regulator
MVEGEVPGPAGSATAVAMGEETDVVAEAAGCGCALGPDAAQADDAGAAPRRAVAVEPAIRQRNLSRLRRIEGQVRGLQKMIEDDRYCADILTQIAAVQEALRSVGTELLRNHLRHCATHAMRAGGEDADRMVDELVALMHRHAR